MKKLILFNEANGLGEIILNRPEAYNALNHEMIIDLTKQLTQWATATHIKAVIISSSHEKVFCAGGDVKTLHEQGKAKDKKVLQFFRDEYRLNNLIFNYPKPYIAFLNGMTMGGGVGISIYASHRIATEKYSFSMPETGIGFFPDVGGSYFLSRCNHHAGKYLGLTGTRINASDALSLKLIDYVVPNLDIESIKKVLRSLDNYSNQAVRECLLQLPQAEDIGQLPIEVIDHCFAPETIEVILDKLNTTNTTWSILTTQTLQKKSPTSLKVTLEQLRRGKKMNFGECLKMEFRIVQHFLQNHDFYEGVNATLISKNQQPQWVPAQLNEVSADMVESYFAPTSEELTF